MLSRHRGLSPAIPNLSLRAEGRNDPRHHFGALVRILRCTLRALFLTYIHSPTPLRVELLSHNNTTATSSAVVVRPWDHSLQLGSGSSVLNSLQISQLEMEDEYHLAAMLPTAGYLFAEELDAHFLALDDFHSMLLQDDWVSPKVTAVECSFNFIRATPSIAPSSPSSVVHLPPCYPPSEGFDNYEPVIKQEPLAPSYHTETVFIKPELEHVELVPRYSTRDDRDSIISEEDKERLRRRQRGYEKRYRGRKRRDLKLQRDDWLALEMKLDASRKKHCRPYVRIEQGGRDSLRYKLLLLKLEERALRQDHIAMRSLQAWEEISRIREYSDKEQLRSVSEWRHSADKVIGRCAVLGPDWFHPYAPLEQRHFTW
ncbi:hypothetical protein PC123_g20421 [Phytophthora cactorum]|nr:hypothetical protein PC123_g20421 [Phytophthora cactorum]